MVQGYRLDELEGVEVYKILVGSVQPRPIAWVSTRSGDGVDNLAPFSFFNIASRNPATLMISIGQHSSQRMKDTLRNVLDTEELVVNIPSEEHADAVTQSSRDVGGEVDEHDIANMGKVPSAVVNVPRLEDSRISLECRLSQTLTIGSDTVIFAEVLYASFADGVLNEKFRVENRVLRPLGRLAGPWYTYSLVERRPQLDQQLGEAR